MAITIQLPDGRRCEFQHDPITIGRSPDCQIKLTDAPVLQDQHARVRKLAGRWLVESLGDWPLQAGTDSPARLCWLKIGDIIRLTQDGPELIFEPALEDVVLDSLPGSPIDSPASTPSPVTDSHEMPPPLSDRSHVQSSPPPLPIDMTKVKSRSIPPPLPSPSQAAASIPDWSEDDQPIGSASQQPLAGPEASGSSWGCLPLTLVMLVLFLGVGVIANRDHSQEPPSPSRSTPGPGVTRDPATIPLVAAPAPSRIPDPSPANDLDWFRVGNTVRTKPGAKIADEPRMLTFEPPDGLELPAGSQVRINSIESSTGIAMAKVQVISVSGEMSHSMRQILKEQNGYTRRSMLSAD